MNCPACGNPLISDSAGDLTLDVCSGDYGGIWFDRQELQRLDDPGEPVDAMLLDIPHIELQQPDPTARRRCIRCEDTVMMRRHFSPQQRVQVDECPSCGSVWLDCGELKAIRSAAVDADDRRRATERFLEAQVTEMAIDSLQEREWSRKITGIFRALTRRLR